MLNATLSPSIARAGALAALLAGVTACAPATPASQASLGAGQAPVLLSCPAGQQPLLRQVVLDGAAIPQVECVTTPAAPAPLAPVAQAPAAQAYYPQPSAAAYASGVPVQAPVAAPVYMPAAASGEAPAPAVRTVSTRPAARHAVYDDDVVEYRGKKGRSWKKSALIIGSSAGVGAGIGAATGGKKGALIGAAIGGGAATVWDQATRR